jgi:DNA-binding GntR family transcriptional regulator
MPQARDSKRTKPLYEQTYEALRAAILRGEILPGERLIESNLAERLAVSRTPIREALRQLQLEGLVQVDNHGGLSVTRFAPADIVHLYECRIALERVAVSGACRHATELEIRAIDMVLTQIESAIYDHALKLDRQQILDLNRKFHRLIAESSGNKWLITLLEQVLDKILLFRVQLHRVDTDVREMHVQHRQIYTAIVHRDIEKAVHLITAHLMTDQERGLRRLQALEAQER